jgi:hypothetical protein
LFSLFAGFAVPSINTRARGVFLGKEEGRWSPSEIVELGSSFDDSPPPKKMLITHYFSKETQSSSHLSQLSNFLRKYSPRTVQFASEQSTQAQPTVGSGSSLPTGKTRSTVYKSYTLGQKLEVLAYVKAHSESKATKHFGIPRTTISSWKGLDQAPGPNDQKKIGQQLSKGSGHRLSPPVWIRRLFAGYSKERPSAPSPATRHMQVSKRCHYPAQSQLQSLNWVAWEIHDSPFTVP